jgi:hypothetical protein
LKVTLIFQAFSRFNGLVLAEKSVDNVQQHIDARRNPGRDNNSAVIDKSARTVDFDLL